MEKVGIASRPHLLESNYQETSHQQTRVIKFINMHFHQHDTARGAGNCQVL